MTDVSAVPAAVPVLPAATVLLLRESDQGLEVLLTKRAAGLSFMAGLWVFPGGRVEPSDAAAEVAARVDATRLESVRQRMHARDGSAALTPEAALALHVAACRETFEEAGVLLARPRIVGQAADPGLEARMAEAREAASTAQGFLALLEREDLLLEADRLVYWAHWITPSLEKKRFDTRFFAVQVPQGQAASVDRSELTHHAWLGQAQVEAALASREMRMAPPTIATLHDLWASHARHGGLAAMLEAERGRHVPPILPKLVRIEDRVFETVLPWDADYERLPGEGCVTVEGCPGYLAALPARRRFDV